jgi:hypothetical protein
VVRGSRPECPFGKVVANVATCTFARVWVVVTYPGNLEQISHSSYVQMVARAQPVLWVGVVSFDPMDWKYVPLGDRLNTVTMEREAVPTQSGNLMCHVAKTLPRMALCPRLRSFALQPLSISHVCAIFIRRIRYKKAFFLISRRRLGRCPPVLPDHPRSRCLQLS